MFLHLHPHPSMKPPTKRLEHASIYPSNYVKEVNVFLSILNNTILVPICASFSVQTHQIELISNCGRIFLRLNFFLLFVCQNYVIFFRCDMQKKRPPTVRNVYCYHPTYISICFLYFFSFQNHSDDHFGLSHSHRIFIS